MVENNCAEENENFYFDNYFPINLGYFNSYTVQFRVNVSVPLVKGHLNAG